MPGEEPNDPDETRRPPSGSRGVWGSVTLRQTQADGDGRRLDPAGDLQLGQDVPDVDADGLLADEQPLADLPVRPALGDERQHLALTSAQPERVRATARRRSERAPSTAAAIGWAGVPLASIGIPTGCGESARRSSTALGKAIRARPASSLSSRRSGFASRPS